MHIFLLGAIAGLVMGLTGAGGGVLAVPLLVFGLGLGVAQAAPVALIGIAAASGVGSALGLKNKTVRYRAALLIGVVGILVSPIGAKAGALLPNKPMTLLFSLILLISALRTFTSAFFSNAPKAAHQVSVPCLMDKSEGRLVWTRRCAVFMLTVGSLSGWLSGMFGVGGGFVIVPALKRYSDVTAREVLSTSLAVIFLVSSVGASYALISGGVDANQAAPFALGCLTALVMGLAIAGRLKQKWVSACFSVVSVVVAFLLVLKVI